MGRGDILKILHAKQSLNEVKKFWQISGVLPKGQAIKSGI
jgi:hypothetical protein